MKHKYTIAIMSFLGGFLSQTLFAADVTNAIAAHLGLHRLDRLVTLGKIDADFQTKFRAVTLENIPHTQATEPAFKALLEQYPGADGTKNALEIIMNGSGKSLKDTVLSGAAAEGAPIWPEKDPVTLSELSQHFLLKQVQTKPELVPFVRALLGYDISQQVDPGGNKVAQVDIKSSETKDKFRIVLKTDGSIVSGAIMSTNTEEEDIF
jgi:hypothetical protein